MLPAGRFVGCDIEGEVTGAKVLDSSIERLRVDYTSKWITSLLPTILSCARSVTMPRANWFRHRLEIPARGVNPVSGQVSNVDLCFTSPGKSVGIRASARTRSAPPFGWRSCDSPSAELIDTPQQIARAIPSDIG